MSTVRIGIVSWNTAALLDSCLHSLPAALGSLDADVVVVDNDSSDASADVAERHVGVTVIRNASNQGYAAAMNQALADSGADVLIALNPDTEPPPESLETLVDRLVRHPQAGMVVPRLVYPSGRLQHSVYRFPSVVVSAVVSFVPRCLQRGWVGRRWWLEGFAPHDVAGPVDWAIGAVHVIRRQALGGGSPYSERWFMYVEDLELCWRLHHSGWEVRLEPDVVVPHVSNAAGAQMWGSARAARYWPATYDFYALTHGRARARLYALMNTIGSAWYLLRRTVRGRPALRTRGRKELGNVVRVHARAVLRPPQGDLGRP